jgi:SAM-dependent methyltransferase
MEDIDQSGDAPRFSGVLCIPFQKPERTDDDAKSLAALRSWIVDSAKKANICLRDVKGSYDSSQQVIDRIYEQIKEADIVVSVVRDTNPNVFYESGFAFGWGKPILYVARKNESVPFDIAGIERFIFDELTSEEGVLLSKAMRRCAEVGVAAKSDALLKARQHMASTTFASGLFSDCVQHALSSTGNWIGSWGPNQLEFTGSEMVTEVGAFILGKLKETGFATQYYPGQRSWHHDRDATLPDYFDAARAAVGRKVAITRVYVLDSREQLDEQALRSRIWADVAAGIEVRHILARDVNPRSAWDFGLWDGSLVGEVEYLYPSDEPPRLHRCRYYADEYHLGQARKWQKAILARARPCPDLPNEKLLLKESSRSRIYDIDGASFCRDRAMGKDDCSDYHLPWQTLRQSGMVSTPSWHGDFYQDELRDWSEKLDGEIQRYRVLITGMADYGMLYWAVQSIPHHVRMRSEFHVLDICNTPLEGCRWLKKRLQECEPPLELDLHVHQLDVLKNDLDADSFDLIVTDAFLTRFTTFATKRSLTQEWIRLLRSNGRLVTTARVKHRRADIRVTDRRRFVETAKSRAGDAHLDIDMVAKSANAYANHIDSSPFKDESEVDRLFADFGDEINVNLSFAPLQESEMVPAKYARIVVRRQA